MNITEIRHALGCAREAALCNADDTAAPMVCLSLDQVERIDAALLRVEEILPAFTSVKASA